VTGRRETEDFIPGRVTRREGMSDGIDRPEGNRPGQEQLGQRAGRDVVLYRLSEVDGRGERNPWSLVTQLPAADLAALRGDRAKAISVLDGFARQHGHKLG
jgi:hypothetical protein